jgi:hypothetical protein
MDEEVSVAEIERIWSHLSDPELSVPAAWIHLDSRHPGTLQFELTTTADALG